MTCAATVLRVLLRLYLRVYLDEILTCLHYYLLAVRMERDRCYDRPGHLRHALQRAGNYRRRHLSHL